MKINWKQKLTSRKFWTAVATFVTLLIVAFGGKASTATQVTSIIIAGATMVAYIFGEGLVDAAGASDNSTSLTSNYSAPIIGTVADTAAETTTATGTAEADQTQQVTSGLSKG